MMWLSVIYYFSVGIVFVVLYFKRARGIYRFVKMTMQIQGPSWWELAKNSKELLSDGTIVHLSRMCVNYDYKPWGIYTTTLDYLLVVSDPDTIAEVFKHPDMRDKSSILYNGLASFLPKGSLVLNGEKWKWHRKTINPAFRKSNLDSRLDIMSEGAEELIETLRAKADGPSFDITDIVDMGTTDMTLRFLTGNIQIVPSARRFYEAVENGMRLVQLQTINPPYHWFKLKFDKATRAMERQGRAVISETRILFGQARIAAKNRLSNRIDSEPVDAIECLSSVTLEPGLDIDEQDLSDEISTLAVGGMETTKATIKTMMMLLALHPDVQQRVYEEVEQILGQNEQPSPQDLQDMKYTDAVIKETLRLYPAIPVIGRKVKRTSNLNGVMIPRGSSVLVNMMALHRNSEVFENPLKFMPDRFITQGQEKRHPYAFLPFGSGPRMRVGYGQAMVTIQVVMAAIVRNFQIVPGENIKSMDDLQIKMSVSIFLHEPMVKLISRKKWSV